MSTPGAARIFTFESRLDLFVEHRLQAVRTFLEGGDLELADAANLCPITWLGERLGLTPTEERVLWLLVAYELCPRSRALLRQLATDEASDPTVDVIDRLVYRRTGSARRIAWRELAPAGSLQRLGLVELGSAPSYRQTLTASRRVLALVHGERELDASVASFARVVDTDPPPLDQLEIADVVVARVAALLSGDGIVAVHGCAGSGRRSLLLALARQHDLAPLAIDARALATDPTATERQLRTLARECALLGLVPVVLHLDALAATDAAPDRLAVLERELPGMILATASRPIARRWQRATTFVALPALTGRQRARVWLRALPHATPAETDVLATMYPLAPALIVAAAAASQHAGTVEAGVRAVVDDRLAGLATRLDTTQTWDDLVLPGDQFVALIELVARIRKRQRVYEDWGFGAKLHHGLGVTALFSGPPGTGKTMCANLIARELGTAIYQVHLDKLVSKWIGETEKNLAALFDAAEACHAILLFDEADSLFGKRTDVKSSNDRRANQEVNFLLQRLETFTGICILTSNHETALDDAFRRRIAVHVRFPLPDLAERTRLWQTLLPSAAPLDGPIAFDALAERFELSGGHIRNAVLRAAFLAADEDRPIAMAHLLKSAQLEYDALGKLYV